MPDFDEGKIKRASDGKFAEKPHSEAASDIVSGDGGHGLVEETRLDPDGTHVRVVRDREGRLVEVTTVNYEPEYRVETNYYSGGVQTGRSVKYEEDRFMIVRHLDSNDEPHCDDGPAVVEVEGDTTTYKYYQHGKLHRDDGPALVRVVKPYFEDDYESYQEEYYRDGLLDREDGPASTRTSNRSGTEIRYARKGRLGREGGPAIIVCGVYGELTEVWMRDNQRHRDGGPAYSDYTGREEYSQYGKLHRDPDEGPAVISDDSEEYWVDGVRIAPPHAYEWYEGD